MYTYLYIIIIIFSLDCWLVNIYLPATSSWGHHLTARKMDTVFIHHATIFSFDPKQHSAQSKNTS